jgi:predicted transcriptional regulator
MKQIWCEWDIGQERLVFRNDDAAMRWIRNNPYLKEDALEDGVDAETYIQDLFDGGELDFIDLEIIE